MLFEDGVEQDNKSLPGFQVRRDTHEVYSDQHPSACLLYTSDAADERSSVDLGGRRIIKKKIHVVVSEYIT